MRLDSFVIIKVSIKHYNCSSGRLVKQEQWESWRANRKLLLGSKHRGDSVGSRGMTPWKI